MSGRGLTLTLTGLILLMPAAGLRMGAAGGSRLLALVFNDPMDTCMRCACKNDQRTTWTWTANTEQSVCADQHMGALTGIHEAI